MNSAESSMEIRRAAADVFALVEDFAQMPGWLESCLEMTQTTPGSHAVGAAVHYRYSIAGQEGAMEGTITAYTPERELALKLEDSQFGVQVGFRIEPTEVGARVYHGIDITIKFELPRYMETMVQAGNRKQVGNNLGRLKRRLEAEGSAPNTIPDGE